VRVDQRVWAIRAAKVPLLVCLRSSCNHVTEDDHKVYEIALKVVMQNDSDFVDVILLYSDVMTC
jgi:hypothetical protein